MKIDKLVRKEKSGGNFPLGVTRTADGVHISAVLDGTECSLLLFEKEASRKIPFLEEEKTGDVWSIELLGKDFSGISYAFEADGKEIPDFYGRDFTGREKWGDLEAVKRPIRARLQTEDFDWQDDRNPQLSYEDTVIYRVHTRGFTKHSSSRVHHKGTFKGIQEKIPYLKELGITTLELMPPNEFREVMMPEGMGMNSVRREEPTGKINYWGYTESFLFAPKASFSSGREKHPVRELKELVRELHKNGMEWIAELYFTGKEAPSVVLDAVRFWVREYHADGIHLSGFADLEILRSDPYLSHTKLFAPFWEHAGKEKNRHLAEYNDGFLVDMRRFLRGDEDQLNALIFRNRRNPKEHAVINYMANTNGFTMMDMVSYEQKHNENNGEDNRDGNSCDYTWNCGAEGATRRKKIAALRKKQLRNAFLMLFLSQGTPLLLSGDEFGATKKGNNNSYCQDNEISWLNWNLLNQNRDIYEFVRYLIAFRKKHPVFHMETEPKNIDYLACGHPDVSYHGVRAWCPEFENFRRQLGILYCGDYGKKADQTADNFFFAAYNMHWEPHEFALPKLPKEMAWHIALNTDEEIRNGIYPEGSEELLADQKQFLIPGRSIVVFAGIQNEKPLKKEKRDAKKEKSQV